MKKPAQVFMLPTNEKADIVLKKNNELLILPTGHIGTNPSKLTQPQHLYILSDEEIKEGDWFVGFADGSIKPFVKQADESTVEINNWQLNKKGHSSNKKIIATTDSSLKLYESETLVRVGGFSLKTNDILLPQLSQSFIEHFVEEYNKGNVITDVMVEYESIGAYANSKYDSDYQLKINSDNTINISMPKDSWSREEVVELLYKHTEYMLSGKKDTLDKWIEENL